MKAEPPLIHFGTDESTVPCRKSYLKTINSEAFQSVFYRDGRGATVELENILGAGIFDFPKDPEVIGKIIELCTEPGDTVLDFFAGSGTTAHACLSRFSTEDSRNFVCVQIPEIVAEASRAKAAGYSAISAITIERVKRVIQGYGENPQPMPDSGFKVYKLTKSNFPRCEFTPDPKASEAENVAALRRYIQEKEAAFLFPLEELAEQAVFDEVLLKCGFQLHYTRTRRDDFPENTVFEVSDGKRTALVCLAWNEAIKDSTLKQLRQLDEAGDKPFFICLERSLDTTTKWNLDHLLGKRLTAF